MITNGTPNIINSVTSLLASIGAINWGLIGLFNFNLVSYLLGEGSLITTSVYTIVGFSGIYYLFTMLIKSNKGTS